MVRHHPSRSQQEIVKMRTGIPGRLLMKRLAALLLEDSVATLAPRCHLDSNTDHVGPRGWPYRRSSAEKTFVPIWTAVRAASSAIVIT
jgi:hypothetical protein